MLMMILSWFGGGPLASIINGINTAEKQALEAKTVEERIASQERADRLRALLADTVNARASAATLPWWMAVIAFFIGMPFAIHVSLIGIGTWWVAPRDWSTDCRCYVDGTGWLEWTRHIPPFPAPFDLQEANVIGYFFGFGAVAVLGGAAVVVARHVAVRK